VEAVGVALPFLLLAAAAAAALVVALQSCAASPDLF
jgi:hypothetical protein